MIQPRVTVLAMSLTSLAILVGGCGGNPACDSAEENLPKCGQEYYGDDNCELLTEDCTDDDLTVLDAAFQCIGNNCDDMSVCDVHMGRLTQACLEGVTGG